MAEKERSWRILQRLLIETNPSTSCRLNAKADLKEYFSMTEFLNMGGYGFYVWSSFGVTALVLAINVFQPIMQHRKALRDADDFYSEEQ